MVLIWGGSEADIQTNCGFGADGFRTLVEIGEPTSRHSCTAKGSIGHTKKRHERTTNKMVVKSQGINSRWWGDGEWGDGECFSNIFLLQFDTGGVFTIDV